MAGRLRTQLNALNELDWAVHELSEKLTDSAPTGTFDFEIGIKHMRGDPLEEKVSLWHQAADGLSTCAAALERLTELLEGRIRKLPTYRPPTATSAQTPGGSRRSSV